MVAFAGKENVGSVARCCLAVSGWTARTVIASPSMMGRSGTSSVLGRDGTDMIRVGEDVRNDIFRVDDCAGLAFEAQSQVVRVCDDVKPLSVNAPEDLIPQCAD